METQTIEVKWFKEFGVDRYGNIDGGMWNPDGVAIKALAVAQSGAYVRNGLSYEVAEICGKDGVANFTTVAIGKDGEPVIDHWSTDEAAVIALAAAKTRLSKSDRYNVARLTVKSEVPA